MRGPLIEAPTTPSRNSRRFVTILALGVGIVGAGALPAAAQEADPVVAPTTTSPPAPDAAPTATTPAPATTTARPPLHLSTPPVNGPLDFAGTSPIPQLNLPPAPERAPATTLKLGDDVVEPWNDEPKTTDDKQADEADQAPTGETSGLGDPLAPSTSTAQIPNFFIGHFEIPPFLLSIYQAAGIQYGVPWEVLAAINAIETDYGRNVNVSSAGATGWMQFMPSSWTQYGVDANADGTKDPYNPVDAIFAAARYLKAAGAAEDLRKAVFAYNHAGWYVDDVLRRARFIAGLPSDLVGSLTGLTQGRSPVAGRLSYTHRAPGAPPRSALNLQAAAGSPAVAVQDGRIMRVGTSPRLGRFVMLRDAYGNTYTYGHLAKLATNVLVAKERLPAKVVRAVAAADASGSAVQPLAPLATPNGDPVPSAPASAGTNRRSEPAAPSPSFIGPPTPSPDELAAAVTQPAPKERLFANPGRSRSLASGGRRQILDATFALPASASLRSYFAGDVGLQRNELELKRMIAGRRVIAGTILGRVGPTSTNTRSDMLFAIRPPGKGAPALDPEPFIKGWRLLESTAIFRANGAGALAGGSIGQILLMSKDTLARRVLANPAIDIYACGRRDIQAGVIDRRVLATLEFLAANGLNPTVSSLSCGHRVYTETGNVSQHASGNGVDIAKINGQPILGNQGAGSIADITVRRLLTLQGAMAPAQIISLMRYDGAPTALAMADHADHIHVGFRPVGGTRVTAQGLRPKQWTALVERLGRIANPQVKPSLRRP
jgi:murein DD-endopeptidase MepM/ murein hydrolase activator NlpD